MFDRVIQSDANPAATFFHISSTDEVMNYDHMLRSIIDLFIAATETTSTSLSWLCLYLSLDQALQKRLHDAIDEVVGDDTEVAHLVKKEVGCFVGCILCLALV